MTRRGNAKFLFRRAAVLALAAALICTMLSGCYLFPEEEEKLYAPTLTVQDVSYTTVPATKSTLERWDSGNGTFQALISESYSFANSGVLKKIYVRAGDVVKAGDLLAEYDTREIDTQIAYQEYMAQRATLTYDVAVSEHGAGSAQAALAKLDADYENNLLESLKAQKGESELRSTIDGVVSYTAALVSTGSYVEPGKTLVTVADTSQIVILYDAKNDEEVYTGMEVKCSLKGRNLEFTGTITQTPNDVPADASKDEKTYAYIEFDEIPGGVTLGSNVFCEILLEKKEDIIVLPVRYLNSTSSRYYVRVLVDGLPEERDVTIGMTDGSNYEITSGLEVGDQIVT